MKLRTVMVSAALLATALAGGAMVSAQPADERVDRRRAVGDWLVESVAESDGGLVVRMIREGEGYRLEYGEAFWRGNSGPVRRFAGERGNCGGVAEGGADVDAELTAAEVRRRLAEQLSGCGADAREVAAALQGMERAFEIASTWAAEAAAMTAAEAAAIAAYGDDNMAMDVNMAWDDNMAVDMNMSAEDMWMDANVALDEANWTNGIEPEETKRRR